MKSQVIQKLLEAATEATGAGVAAVTVSANGTLRVLTTDGRVFNFTSHEALLKARKIPEK
jgi:peptide deformylase